MFRALRNTGDDEEVARIHSPAPPQAPELPRRSEARATGSSAAESRGPAPGSPADVGGGRPSTSWVRRGGQVESPLDRTGVQRALDNLPPRVEPSPRVEAPPRAVEVSPRALEASPRTLEITPRTVEMAPRTVHDLPTAPVKRPPAGPGETAPRRQVALPHAIVEVQRSGVRTTVPGGGSSYASAVRGQARPLGDTQRGAGSAGPVPPPSARPSAARGEPPHGEPPRPPPLSGVVMEPVRRGTDVTAKTPVVPPASGAISPALPSRQRTPSAGVVVSRPAVIIGATPSAPRGPGTDRLRPASAVPGTDRLRPMAPVPPRPQAPRAREVRFERTTQETAFGQDLISEKSLDEVILAYLSEDSPEE
jgi:hypothetical protein